MYLIYVFEKCDIYANKFSAQLHKMILMRCSILTGVYVYPISIVYEFLNFSKLKGFCSY